MVESSMRVDQAKILLKIDETDIGGLSLTKVYGFRNLNCVERCSNSASDLI